MTTPSTGFIHFAQLEKGGEPSSTFVYSPTAPKDTRNVYNTWDCLYVVLLAANGPVTVQIDAASAAISGAFAPYDLSGITFIGKDPTDASTSTILNVSAQLSNLPDTIGPGITLTSTLGTFAYITSSTDERLFIDRLGKLDESGGSPLIKVDTAHTFHIYMDGTVDNTTVGVIEVGTNSTLKLFAFDGADARSTAPSGIARSTDNTAAIVVDIMGSSALVDDTTIFVPYTGSYTVNLKPLALNTFYDNTSSGLSAENMQDAVDELTTGAATWADAGTYLRPSGGAAKNISIGTAGASITTEDLRVGGNQRIGGYLILNDTHPEGGTVESRFGFQSTLPANATGWGKGSMLSKTDEGKLYINEGTSAAVNWIVVGVQGG